MPSAAPTSKVTNKPRQAAGRPDPWSAALRWLTRRDYSHAELRQRLLDKGFDPTGIEKALQRCLEHGYLDDARYARNRAASLMAQGRAVGPRILADLRQHGIDEDLACQALELARAACDEDELLRQLLGRRFPAFDYDSAPAKERRRVVHFLQRRGFPLGRIMAQLTRKGSSEHDENR
jgi:regulatory protein